MNASLVYFALFIMFTLFQIGFCTYMDACVEDFQAILTDVSKATEIRNDILIKNGLKEAIKIHADMLE